MNPLRLLVAACLSCAALFSVTAFAQSQGPKAKLFAKYDTNKNGVIDGDEIAVVRQAFTADPKGEFAAYDKDHDGKLSDEEIAGIKPPGGGKKGGEKKDSGKKKAAPAADSDPAAAPEKKDDAK